MKAELSGSVSGHVLDELVERVRGRHIAKQARALVPHEIASAGKLVRAEIEQSMREQADRLGLELTITEHPHLLTCQVLFEVTGQRHKIDELAADLNAEEMATMRAERTVMLSPL